MVLIREIKFEEGWSYIQKVITKLIRVLEGEPEPELTADDYTGVYTTVYNMCAQTRYKEPLRDRYRQVVPFLREKHDEYLLRELVKRWNNHKVMVNCLYKFFYYLDRYSNHHNPRLLKEIGWTCFHDLVYPEMQSNANKVVIALIHKEREGAQIDRDLVKNVLDVYVENGMGTTENFEDEFESFMFNDTSSYYRDYVFQSRNTFAYNIIKERGNQKL